MEQDHIEDYLRGFNEGYLIARHNPVLGNALAKIESSAPRIEGLRDGRKQFVKEFLEELHKDAPVKSEASPKMTEASKVRKKGFEDDK